MMLASQVRPIQENGGEKSNRLGSQPVKRSKATDKDSGRQADNPFFYRMNPRVKTEIS